MFDNGDTLIPSRRKKKLSDDAGVKSPFADNFMNYFQNNYMGNGGIVAYVSDLMSGGINKSRVSRTKTTSV